MAFDSSLILSEQPLPKRWEIVSGAEVSVVNRAQISKRDAPHLLKYIDISSVDTRNMAAPTLMTFDSAPSRARRCVAPGDTLISTVRPNLKHFVFLASPEKDWIASTGFAVVSPKKNIDPRYLYYYLTCDAFTNYLTSVADGAAYPAFNPSEISEAEILLPPLDEQRAIAHILGSLDDKIELNRKTIETLEAMARAVFQSWFVDFDPVQEKVEERQASLPKSLSTLFPNRFVESDLGLIPVGWEVCPLNDLAMLLRDSENPMLSPQDIFHHYSIPAFDEGQCPKCEAGESIKSVKSRVPPNVVLLSKLNPETDRVWLVDVRPREKAVCSTEFLVLVPNAPVGRSYLYCLARSKQFRNDLESLVTGTSSSHQRAQVDSILGLKTVRASKAILVEFERLVEPMLSDALERRRESQALATMRDALLPGLLSGELRINDAKQLIARAT